MIILHPDIIWYFITIPETVYLILMVYTYIRSSEIFVFDIDKAVKIDTLAKFLIWLTGYKLGVDIKIVCSGL